MRKEILIVYALLLTLVLPVGIFYHTETSDIASTSVMLSAMKAPRLLSSSEPIDTITITITEDLPVIGFQNSTISASESDQSVTLTVNISCVSNFDTTVFYTTSNMTALSGRDYTSLSGTLTIPAGQTTATIVVPLLEDTVYDPDVTFKTTLSAPVNATLGTDKNVATISDNDPAPTVTPTPTAASTPATSVEGAGRTAVTPTPTPSAAGAAKTGEKGTTIIFAAMLLVSFSVGTTAVFLFRRMHEN